MKSRWIKTTLTAILLVTTFLVIGWNETQAQKENEESPKMIEKASKMTLEILNASGLQGMSVKEKVSLLERPMNSLGIWAEYTVIENAPISVVIGNYIVGGATDYPRSFIYFYTKEEEGEKYCMQLLQRKGDISDYPSQSEDNLDIVEMIFYYAQDRGKAMQIIKQYGRVMVETAKIRKHDGCFLMDTIIIGGVAADWQCVSLDTLRWDGQNWQEIWSLNEDINYKKVSKLLEERFGIPGARHYSDYGASLSDLDGDGVDDELRLSIGMHDEEVFPFSCEADVIPLELIYEGGFENEKQRRKINFSICQHNHHLPDVYRPNFCQN